MRRSGAERYRRWLPAAALLLAAPKCVLCVLAYTGLGAALGRGGVELCGGDPAAGAPGAWPAFALLGAALLAWAAFRRAARPPS